MEPILVQIIGVGVNAFMTVKANVPANATLRTPKKEYNQKAVWTNEQDGIITVLKRHAAANPESALARAPWLTDPTNHVPVIQAVERFIAANKHLYTEGMEQGEDAPAGSTGTKSEEFTTLQPSAHVSVCSEERCEPSTKTLQ